MRMDAEWVRPGASPGCEAMRRKLNSLSHTLPICKMGVMLPDSLGGGDEGAVIG